MEKYENIIVGAGPAGLRAAQVLAEAGESRLSMVLPFLLILLGFYVIYFQNRDGFMWVFWGLFLSLFAASGHPKPVNDDIPLGRGRMALGIIAFVLGLLSITLVPIQIR